ncbi:MAG: hypothetical protein K2X91_18930, partial [Thermoleophilia bacterium]|nr:hypothetical protein [Thermoleophilia bacterium]
IRRLERNPIMLPKSIPKIVADAACAVVSRTTGVPLPRPYAPAAEARFGPVRLVAVPLADVPAFWSCHPRAVAGGDALAYLESRARRSERDEAVMSDALKALLRLRAAHPNCVVFLVREVPAFPPADLSTNH